MPCPAAQTDPSGPTVAAAAVGVHDGRGAAGQGDDGLPEHGAGQSGVRIQAGDAGDDPAVTAVNHGRRMHLAITGLDFGDAGRPLHVAFARTEATADRVLGRGRPPPRWEP
jgi:hypothetical protein